MPALDEKELAQNYGFAMAVLNSNPELKALFKKAVAGTWTPEKFTAELRATKWYKTKGESVRNASILKASDPATYRQNVSQVQTRIGMMASEIGAVLGSKLGSFAESAYQQGWDDNQIRSALSTYVHYTDGRLIGQAGQWSQELRQQAADMGMTYSDSWYENQIRSAVGGKQSIEDAKGAITANAVSAFPHLADRLRAGETLATIADPYKQTMAGLLELNPEAVTLQDPSIRGALAKKGQDGTAGLQTLFDFENTVRADKRWLKTKNAQDAGMSITSKVLSDMGLVK